MVAVGPWIPYLWRMLGLADRIDVRAPDGSVEPEVSMWTYWYLQEGEVALAPSTFVTDDGRESPVLHVDSDRPLHDDDGPPGHRGAVGDLRQARPRVGPGRRPAAAGGSGARGRPLPDRDRRGGLSRPLVRGALALPGALRGLPGASTGQVRSGGAGAFTADNFPVFDYMRPNVYVAADSNHGYKMIAVGREIARVLQGEHSSLLHPFRFERFATGDLHPVSHSPYPWS